MLLVTQLCVELGFQHGLQRLRKQFLECRSCLNLRNIEISHETNPLFCKVPSVYFCSCFQIFNVCFRIVCREGWMIDLKQAPVYTSRIMRSLCRN